MVVIVRLILYLRRKFCGNWTVVVISIIFADRRTGTLCKGHADIVIIFIKEFFNVA